MEDNKFRKINIKVPVQRTYNERPWLIAGLLFALLILLMALYFYLKKGSQGM